MTAREQLISYVKNGGEKFLCSPQIGAGAGFDTKLAGKSWIGDTTLEDTRRAWEMFDVVPLYNFGLPDLSQFAPDVRYESEQRFDPAANRRFSTTTFHTPKGDLVSTAIEDEWKGSCCTKYLITDEEELDILEYYLDQLLQEGDFSPISASIREMRRVIGEDQALDIQWAMQPYELLCFPNTMDTAVFALTCPEIFRRLMDKILRLDEKLLPVVAAGGADFVFLGGPGSEMISPSITRTSWCPTPRSSPRWPTRTASWSTPTSAPPSSPCSPRATTTRWASTCSRPSPKPRWGT